MPRHRAFPIVTDTEALVRAPEALNSALRTALFTTGGVLLGASLLYAVVILGAVKEAAEKLENELQSQLGPDEESWWDRPDLVEKFSNEAPDLIVASLFKKFKPFLDDEEIDRMQKELEQALDEEFPDRKRIPVEREDASKQD